MPWRESVEPIAMSRIAVLAPIDRLRDTLVYIAEAGTVELDTGTESEDSEAGEALHRLQSKGIVADRPALLRREPAVGDLEARQAADLLAGEVDLARHAAASISHGPTAAMVGWIAQRSVPDLQQRIEPLGAALVALPVRPWMEPPTQLRGQARSSFAPLVNIYGTVKYRDVDPTSFTGASFVLMFGMMFADAGEGLLLAMLGLYARFTRRPGLAAVKRVWALPFWGGIVACVFGLAYGEVFGPTGLVPTLWLSPLQNPITLVGTGVVVGTLLLSISYLIGIVNRFREGGLIAAVFAASGVAGFLLFVAVAIIALRFLVDAPGAMPLGLGLAGLAIVLLFTGLLLEAGFSAIGVFQALIELLNQIVRMAANAVSFARLAAFGMVHAAIGELVWKATVALWTASIWPAAAVVFLAGTGVAFSLELLVAAIQALRLEYYELYSRIFAGEGRPFQPWHLPVLKEET